MSHSPARIALIQQIIPLLWDISFKTPKISSYGAKHCVEHALQYYITNDEFIEAAKTMGIPHTVGNPNYGFALKEKFPLDWFQPSYRLSTRPPYETKKKWEAYQVACKTIDDIVHNLIKDDTSDETRYGKITRAIGNPDMT